MDKVEKHVTFLLVFVCFIICFSYKTFSQSKVESFPLQFTQFINSYPLTNPACIGAESDNEAIVGYQQPVKGISGVSTYYFNFSFVPFKSKSAVKRKNVVGLRLYSDKEGAYIKRSRFYAMYAFHTRLNSKINFSGGIDFGGLNFVVKPTPTTGGASNFNYDANAGIWLYNSEFHVGLSLNQIFRNDLQPIDEITELPMHFNISASKTIIKTDIFILRPHVLITYPYYSNLSIRGCLYGLIAHKVITEIGMKYKENISFCFGINDINFNKSRLDLAVSYTAQTQVNSYGINMIELSLSYSF